MKLNNFFNKFDFVYYTKLSYYGIKIKNNNTKSVSINKEIYDNYKELGLNKTCKELNELLKLK